MIRPPTTSYGGHQAATGGCVIQLTKKEDSLIIDPIVPCTPISLTLAVLLPDDLHQISFGLTKGCNPDDTAFWIIDFVFRDKVGTAFQDRVKLNLTVNAENSLAAEALANSGLTNMDITFLNGPITNRARRLPAGTTEDHKTARMLTALVDQHAPE